jgi:hypothetical protein
MCACACACTIAHWITEIGGHRVGYRGTQSGYRGTQSWIQGDKKVGGGDIKETIWDQKGKKKNLLITKNPC